MIIKFLLKSLIFIYFNNKISCLLIKKLLFNLKKKFFTKKVYQK